MYKRVLIKISGEAMLGENSNPIDQKFLNYLAEEIGAVYRKNIEVAIVVGGGNIFRGLSVSEQSGIDRTTGDNMGMLATVINALALQASFENNALPTRVMSAISMNRVAEPFIRRRAVRHLEKGRIVIFAAGTGNPFFTTDTAAALRANEINADLLVKATKVDGLFDKDPAKFEDAKFIEKISFKEAINLNLRVMDTTALSLCEENNLPVKIVNIFNAGNIEKALDGNSVGSTVTK